MLFRPKFCANCGEKIERVDWGIFTSRRFCPICETEFKGQDLIPRAIVVGSLLVAVLGAGSYLKSGPAPLAPLVTKQNVKPTNQPTIVNPVSTQPSNNYQQPNAADVQSSISTPRTLVSQPPITQQQTQKPVAEESSYYCGAETKKGTPCTRRVKGNTRCFQHKGMPAILPADKLKIG